MNVLVVGSGGREHALVKAFSISPSVKKIFCVPGNPGIIELAQCESLDLRDHEKIIQFAKTHLIDLIFIGPEEPLVEGLSDSLRLQNFRVIGPSKQAAQLEGSKIFSKEFMKRAGVSTARAVVVKSVQETLDQATAFSAPYILKADGLAAGKGVFICKNIEELESAAQFLFVDKKLGVAGEKALLEQNLPGTELSYIVLTNGESYEVLPLAQDHKRLLDRNKGPNTGGMGTLAPLKIDPFLDSRIQEQIIKPTVQQLKRENMLYRGVLFVGVMVVDETPYALEYNVRFGDPETQVILPLIENDLGLLFANLANGLLDKIKISNKVAFCLVNAAPGYPDSPQKGLKIQIESEKILSENYLNFPHSTYILQASTKTESGHLLTNGGRVLNVISIADSALRAKENLYKLNQFINFEGRQYRKDIGDYQFQRKDN